MQPLIWGLETSVLGGAAMPVRQREIGTSRTSAWLPDIFVRRSFALPQTEAKRLVEGLVKPSGASAAFVNRIKTAMASWIPTPMLRDLQKAEYQVELKAHLRDGNPKMAVENDYLSGFHEWGPLGNLILLSENTRSKFTEQWGPSREWENALVHETGHAVSVCMARRDLAERVTRGERLTTGDGLFRTDIWDIKTFGITEAPAFRQAWEADYANMPDALKKDADDGAKDNFHYFLRPGPEKRFLWARQETFAEALDVLIRGPKSRFNHDLFHQHFPETLKALQAMVKQAYGTVGGTLPETPSQMSPAINAAA